MCLQIQKWILSRSLFALSLLHFGEKLLLIFTEKENKKKFEGKVREEDKVLFIFLLKLFFLLCLFLFLPFFRHQIAYHWDHNENTYSDAGYGSKTYDWRPVPYIYSMCFASLLSRIKSDRSKVLVHTKIFCFFFRNFFRSKNHIVSPIKFMFLQMKWDWITMNVWYAMASLPFAHKIIHTVSLFYIVLENFKSGWYFKQIYKSFFGLILYFWHDFTGVFYLLNLLRES